MRLFIGIEFPGAALSAINACQDRVRQVVRRGRFKRPDNFHLTLKFLGEVSAAGVGDISEPLADIARKVRPFRLELGRVGQFGQGNPVRVVWLDVSGDVVQLKELQGQVEQGLAASGFSPDNRVWRPHITLAQDVEVGGDFFSWESCFVEAVSFEVGEFALILSEEQGRQRIYTPIQRFILGGA